MQREAGFWQLFLRRGYKLKTEMASRGFEMFLASSSVAELQRGCVWYVWGLSVGVREALEISLGARPGPLSCQNTSVCLLSHWTCMSLCSSPVRAQRGRRWRRAASG